MSETGALMFLVSFPKRLHFVFRSPTTNILVVKVFPSEENWNKKTTKIKYNCVNNSFGLFGSVLHVLQNKTRPVFLIFRSYFDWHSPGGGRGAWNWRPLINWDQLHGWTRRTHVCMNKQLWLIPSARHLSFSLVMELPHWHIEASSRRIQKQMRFSTILQSLENNYCIYLFTQEQNNNKNNNEITKTM